MQRRPEKSDVCNLLLNTNIFLTEKILELGIFMGRLSGGKLSEFTFSETILPAEVLDFRSIFLNTIGKWRNELRQDLRRAGLLQVWL